MDRVQKSYLRMGLFLLLAGITVSSAILYFSSLKERYDLSVAVNRLKLQLKNLEQEKQNLFQELEVKKELEARLIEENAAFKENILSIQEQVSALSSAFKSAQARVERLSCKIQTLQVQNKALATEKEALNAKLMEVSQESQVLRSKFDSIVELKKAIKDLRRRMRQAKREIRTRTAFKPEPESKPKPEPESKPKPEPESKPKPEQASEGNRGFIVKDGKPTLPVHRIRIEVKPSFDADAQ